MSAPAEDTAPRIEGVVPIRMRDFERFRILARSLTTFFPTLGHLWVVTPPADCEAVERSIRADALLPAFPWTVLDETALVPELRVFRHLKGWYRQQLVKLAIAERVESAHYITFDADVVCTRPVSGADLVIEGRVPCAVLPEDAHPDWYAGAVAVLGLAPRRQGILHNVTPAVLATEAVGELQAHLATRARERRFSRGWRAIPQQLALSTVGRALTRRALGGVLADWRLYLAASAPWTEYALYYTFLEASDRYARYHFDDSRCIYDVERSVWRRTDFASWDPTPLFQGEGPPYFAVIQSINDASPAEVAERLAPFLGTR